MPQVWSLGSSGCTYVDCAYGSADLCKYALGTLNLQHESLFQISSRRTLGVTVGKGILMVHRGFLGTNQAYKGYVRTVCGLYKVVGLGVHSKGHSQSSVIETLASLHAAKPAFASECCATGRSANLGFMIQGGTQSFPMSELFLAGPQ